ncbi:DUF1345 domain-containing protein [Sphingomonas sp. MMS24-JH45]
MQNWRVIVGRVAPPRFMLFLLVFAFAAPWGVLHHGWQRGPMLAFDVATFVFLLSIPSLFGKGSVEEMRATAQRTDANRAELLAFTVIASSRGTGWRWPRSWGGREPRTRCWCWRRWRWRGASPTSSSRWDYAHLYYMPGERGDAAGLYFPGEDAPDYADFLDFAVTLGMTFQTSDVAITSREMRRVVTGQSVAAFVFNLGVVAFTINVLGGGG